jgi:hypothetical protein
MHDVPVEITDVMSFHKHGAQRFSMGAEAVGVRAMHIKVQPPPSRSGIGHLLA